MPSSPRSATTSVAPYSRPRSVRASCRPIRMIRSAPSCLADSTASSPTAPSPMTATVSPAVTPARWAACQPVPYTSDRVSSEASRPSSAVVGSTSGTLTRVPSASGTRTASAWQPAVPRWGAAHRRREEGACGSNKPIPASPRPATAAAIAEPTPPLPTTPCHGPLVIGSGTVGSIIIRSSVVAKRACREYLPYNASDATSRAASTRFSRPNGSAARPNHDSLGHSIAGLPAAVAPARGRSTPPRPPTRPERSSCSGSLGSTSSGPTRETTSAERPRNWCQRACGHEGTGGSHTVTPNSMLSPLALTIVTSARR